MKKSTFIKSVFSFSIISTLLCLPLQAAIKVGASVNDIASIASSIGGDQVETFSIAKSNVNPHSVEVLPSYMIQVSRAAVFLKVGMSLDQWADAIIDGSRNNKLVVADCSQGISVLEKPDGKIDASKGDVHPQGNPHYWLNPANANIIGQNILSALQKADPAHADLFAANFEKFKNENERRLQTWKVQLANLHGQKIITYHSSWIYFTTTFGMSIVGYVEPFPGIPPSGNHLNDLVNLIKANKVKLLFQEAYFPDEAPKFLERQTSLKVFKFSPSSDSPKAGAYWKHFEDIIAKLKQESIIP